ncbi:para-nitrobenzyl esterase [Streptomyces sp. SAI-208]|uniref:carboxylesterase/lipase family protein n=1 Tax=Streptomyces sp. SAI-208 TaxID=2940550 RepID=UPI0024749DBD|nr:carboxylesterase family protein [Streptomyces sp. SAI-208]MDH6604680.1 para-nitrobenzyl esterase [Streptomyces sp. SAI-208]
MSKDVHGTQVTVEGGTVEGRLREGVVSFLGVPYAAPPFGADRMGPPQPVVPWQGVRDAARMGPTVPKGDYPPAFRRLFPEVEIGGEECLNRNVWTPDLKAGGLPVLVWIHGGSFANGSNSVAACDGSALARSGVVCAAINYRLAAECFLFLDDCLANLGLQDQVAALEWVRDNIAAFGGDPGNVTMAGESAGAMSVATLLAMPSAAGLFARAVTQSGAAANTLTAEQGLTVGSLLAEALEVPTTRDAIAAVPQDRLRRAASEVVTEVQLGTAPDKWASLDLRGLSFAPVVDGTVLPVHPLDAARVGAGVPVPLLTGWNRDENRLGPVAVNMLDTVEEFTLLAGAAGTGLGRKGWRSTAPRVPARPPGDLLAAIGTDWSYALPALQYAEARIAGDAGPPGCTASTTWRRPTTTASARATPPSCRSSSGRRTTTAYGPSSETIPRRRQPPQHTRRGCTSRGRGRPAGSPMTQPAVPPL